jgi:hypothetical protein
MRHSCRCFGRRRCIERADVQRATDTETYNHISRRDRNPAMYMSVLKYSDDANETDHVVVVLILILLLLLLLCGGGRSSLLSSRSRGSSHGECFGVGKVLLRLERIIVSVMINRRQYEEYQGEN